MDGCEAAVRPSITIRQSPNTRRSPNNNYRGVNIYEFYPGGVAPLSTRTTKTFQRISSMTPVSADGRPIQITGAATRDNPNPTYTQTIRTQGGNVIQMSNNNTRGAKVTAMGEFVDNAILNFEFVKFVIYTPEGVKVETKINLLDYKDIERQRQWDKNYKELQKELGPMPFLNGFDPESIKKYNEYQQIIQDRIGTSPIQQAWKEYLQHPEKFKEIDSKKEVIPEFRQGYW